MSEKPSDSRPVDSGVRTPPMELTYEEVHQLMFLLDDEDHFGSLALERRRHWRELFKKIQRYRYRVERGEAF